MRRFLTGFVVAAVTVVVPALAMAGNQQVAEEIANRLKTSGQMSDYSIGVKYQKGTAWLHGHVSSPEQMKAALRLTFKTASVDRVVNQLTIAPSDVDQPAKAELARTNASEPGNRVTPAGYNPLRDPNSSSLAKANQPQKMNLLARLEAVARRKPKAEASQPLPIREEAPVRDEQQPSAQRSTITQTSAEEPQELPPAKQARPATRVAMMQPGVRGPVAPNGAPMPMYQAAAAQAGVAPARYDQPCMPNYAWPSYAAYPNYAAVTYPKQYSPTAWPYIGPFYPYPQVPLGWRKVTLEWDSGWWFLDFKDQPASCWQR
jgi:hypothetical protein